MKLVISASVLSAMVFYSSLLPFLHSLNLYISATIHKNYMFLLCNGLLVFIVRNSGLISSSGREQCGGHGSREAESPGAAMEDSTTIIERKVEDGEERENGFIAEEEQEESERLVTEEEQQQEHEEQEEQEEEEEEAEEVGALSNEELDKKFEEFIRKMKAGIKLESQQVLIL
ncbi:hypothetical protein SDJN02_26769, partial [Cucurbita argyrosperma subsp. argyrosperma]